MRITNAGDSDLRRLLVGSAQPRAFAQTPANETQPAVSPDGRWLAYVSDARSGTRDILVEAFPDGGRKVRASGEMPGVQPVWRKDGRELFYLGVDQRLIAVSVEQVAGELRLGEPSPLFETMISPAPGLGTRANYDATGDGSRFIAIEPRNQQGPRDRTLTVLVDWKSKLGAER